MKKTIVTIPISEIFGPKCGCPFCRMERMLEERYVEYIVGDAMMEPSIRVETNKTGFCHRHFSKMFQKGQKLPNALLLETHLQEIFDNYMPKKPGGKPDKKKLEAIKRTLGSCFVCERIEKGMVHLTGAVLTEWAKGGEFRTLFSEQEYICLKHYVFVSEAASGKGGLPSKLLGDFNAEATNLTKNYLQSLNEDVADFIAMFDYRNRDKEWGKSVDVIERSIAFLTGEKPAED